MKKKFWTILGLALGTLVLGVVVGLMTVGTVAADPTPGVKIQIPRIDVGDVLGTGRWETWIHVQNVSHDVDTGAIFLGWGEYSGLCPTNDPGIIVHYCQLIRGNAVWTLRSQLATDEIKSGIIYSVKAEAFQEACATSALTEGNTNMWREWLKELKFGTGMDITKSPPVPMTWGPAEGEKLAVTVTRYGPNDYGTFVSSTYTGISEEMEGEDHPYEYYAPYIMKGYNGLDTEMTIQNSGEMCTSVWINYMEQGSCRIVYKYHVEQLAPGEAVRLKVPCNVGQIPCNWLGSAHIAAKMPLRIIIDQTSFDEPCVGVDRGTLLTHRARPKKELRDGVEIEDRLVYADLIFREWSGWDASIQVQNLSRTGQNTFVTVDFMDNSGDEILFLADWICPGGSATFYLPIVNNLGFDYVGAAEIQSHEQVSYPGGKVPGQPIFAVVDLKKPDDPRTPELDAQGGSYNAHPYSQKEWVSEIALPFVTKDAGNLYTPWTSLIAIRNNSNCNKIKTMIWFKDETGRHVCELPVSWLHPKHVKLIDLNNVGCLYPGYVGSAKVIVTEVEQLCDKDNDGHADNLPFMPSVIVVAKGLPFGGDVTSIYEGIPYSTGDKHCDADLLGQVIDDNTYLPLQGVTVTVPGGKYIAATGTYVDATGTTGRGGMYEIKGIVTFGTLEPEPGTCYTVTASKNGYLSSIVPDVCLHCGEDKVLDFSLICNTNTITGTVKQYVTPENSGPPIAGATVTATWDPHPGTDDDGVEKTTTNAQGYYELKGLPKEVEITVTIEQDGYDSESNKHTFLLATCNEKREFSPILNCYAEVRGVVWFDLNSNGQWDCGEPLLQGQKVHLFTDGKTKFLGSATTDEYGRYKFNVGKDLFDPGDFNWGDDLDVVIGTTVKDTAAIWPCTVNVVNFPLK